jgi:membrane-associated phospholipid phosphatase
MREAVTFLTDFADQAVLLPLALVVALCLGISGWWRGAAAWLLGVGATLTLMLLFKIAFIACGPADDVLRSPSGHTAAAAVVCGGLATVLGVSRRLTVPVAFLAALIIGGSRLALGAHTPLETLVGGATGIGGAWLIARSAGPAPAFRRGRVAIAAILVVVVLHGARMPAEAHIRGLAWRVGLLLPACRAT